MGLVFDAVQQREDTRLARLAGHCDDFPPSLPPDVAMLAVRYHANYAES